MIIRQLLCPRGICCCCFYQTQYILIYFIPINSFVASQRKHQHEIYLNAEVSFMVPQSLILVLHTGNLRCQVRSYPLWHTKMEEKYPRQWRGVKKVCDIITICRTILERIILLFHWPAPCDITHFLTRMEYTRVDILLNWNKVNRGWRLFDLPIT